MQAINNADQTRREYEQEIEKLEKEYDMLADKLTEKRKKQPRFYKVWCSRNLCS